MTRPRSRISLCIPLLTMTPLTHRKLLSKTALEHTLAALMPEAFGDTTTSGGAAKKEVFVTQVQSIILPCRRRRDDATSDVRRACRERTEKEIGERVGVRTAYSSSRSVLL